MILPGREDPRNCVGPKNLGQSEGDQKLWKIECVFSLNDKMRWKWDAVYVPQGLPNIYSMSLIPPPLPQYLSTPTVTPSWYTCRPWLGEWGDALGGRDRANWEMHLEAVIDRVWRCTGRPWSSECGNALGVQDRVNSEEELGGRDQLSLEIHWEAEVKWTQRCTSRPWLSEFGDAIGDRDWVNSEMHLEAVIEPVSRCTLRPWSSEFGDAIGDRDWVNSDIHSEAVVERVWRFTCSRLWSREIGGVLRGGRLGGRRDGSWDSIHSLTCNRGNVESWVQHPPWDGKLAGSWRLSILGWCCTWCMLYPVITHN